MILPRLDGFKPDLVLISAGFDAHTRDPLANLNLVEADFAWVTAKLMDLADSMLRRPRRLGARGRLRPAGARAIGRRACRDIDARVMKVSAWRAKSRARWIDSMAEPDTHADVKKLSFEKAIEELETIVKRLEEGKVPLEELVAIYERGEALKRRCEELLRQAEARVEKITLDAAGKPKGTEPLDVK